MEIEAEGAQGDRIAQPVGRPRLANRMLRRVRDFAPAVLIDGVIDRAGGGRCARAGWRWTSWDWTPPTAGCWRSIIVNYGGGPVGLETLAATIGEEAITLEDVYEPYLMQIGFLTRTPRGTLRYTAGI